MERSFLSIAEHIAIWQIWCYTEAFYIQDILVLLFLSGVCDLRKSGNSNWLHNFCLSYVFICPKSFNASMQDKELAACIYKQDVTSEASRHFDINGVAPYIIY